MRARNVPARVQWPISRPHIHICEPVMASAIRWYSQQLVARPVVTKTVTAVAIAAAGDLACQRMQKVDRVVRAAALLGVQRGVGNAAGSGGNR